LIKYSIIICVALCSFQTFSQMFPEFWSGEYEGHLKVFGVDSVSMTVGMKLKIEKKTDSIYQWKMIYNLNENEDIRNYELLIVDRKKGHYNIDEKNSIVINGYYKTGIYTSFFEVNKSMIIATYTKTGEDLLFEIISANGENPLVSGNSIDKGKQIPEVNSFKVNGRQKCLLKRLN